MTEIGDNDFEIVNGSTSKMKDYGTELMEKNSSKMFNWTVRPTDKWAGGSIPLNIVYQLNDFDALKILVNGEFTIAYPYISNEHYEGEIPTSEEQPVSKTEPSPISASAPAFTLAGAISILALVFALLRR